MRQALGRGKPRQEAGPRGAPAPRWGGPRRWRARAAPGGRPGSAVSALRANVRPQTETEGLSPTHSSPPANSVLPEAGRSCAAHPDFPRVLAAECTPTLHPRALGPARPSCPSSLQTLRTQEPHFQGPAGPGGTRLQSAPRVRPGLPAGSLLRLAGAQLAAGALLPSGRGHGPHARNHGR